MHLQHPTAPWRTDTPGSRHQKSPQQARVPPAQLLHEREALFLARLLQRLQEDRQNAKFKMHFFGCIQVSSVSITQVEWVVWDGGITNLTL